MSDEAGIANDYAEEERSLAIRNIRSSIGSGLSHCTKCDEPISELRQDIGATLCVYHTEEKERQDRGY